MVGTVGKGLLGDLLGGSIPELVGMGGEISPVDSVGEVSPVIPLVIEESPVVDMITPGGILDAYDELSPDLEAGLGNDTVNRPLCVVGMRPELIGNGRLKDSEIIVEDGYGNVSDV